MIHALPEDVLLHVVSFLPSRKDKASLASCCRYLADVARETWHDWFRIHQHVVFYSSCCDCWPDKYTSLVAALENRTLPATTHLAFNHCSNDDVSDANLTLDDVVCKGGEGGDDRAAAARKLALLAAAVARAPNLQAIGLHMLTVSPTYLVPALHPLKHLRRLELVMCPGKFNDNADATWRFNTLGLTDLSIHVHDNNEMIGWGERVNITVPSSVTALRLSDFFESGSWNTNELLPTGLRKLCLLSTYVESIDFSRLKRLETLLVEDPSINLHDLPDSLTTLRLSFNDQDNARNVRILDAIDGPLDGPLEGIVAVRIAHLTRLRDLDISLLDGLDHTALRMDSLSRLSRLARLTLGTVGQMDTAVLGGTFPSLKHLRLDVNPAPHCPPVPPLPHAPLLSTLCLSLSGTSYEHVDHPNIRPVPLHLGPLPQARDLCRYPHLRSLQLHCAELDGPAAVHLVSLPLKALVLNACKVTESARAALSGAPFDVRIGGDPGTPTRMPIFHYFDYNLFGDV